MYREKKVTEFDFTKSKWVEDVETNQDGCWVGLPGSGSVLTWYHVITKSFPERTLQVEHEGIAGHTYYFVKN